MRIPRIAILCWEAGHVPRGLMQLESLIGNSTNLDTYPFPVRICRITGANIETVLENPSRVIMRRMIEESKKMIGEGIQAITTSCGFNAIFHRELKEELPVPIFTSSLLQVPFVHSLLSPGKIVAVITAKKSALRPEHFEGVGITKGMPVEVFGMESSKEWNRIFTHPDEDFDLETVSREVVETARAAIDKFPEIGSFVLECTDLPPFAQAIRDSTGCPVFDFQTMLGFVARSIGEVPNY
jgi:hypothetical protein